MADSMSKQELIGQLAVMARTSSEQARVMLEGLVRLALRGAKNGFEIPGLCRLEISECRSPMDRNDGYGIQKPAHRELRLIPTQEAINFINKMPNMGAVEGGVPFKGAVNDLAAQLGAMAQPEEEEQEVVEPQIAEEDAYASEEDMEEHVYITFCCANCGQEIEASTDMANMEAQCPGCGSPIRVPSLEAMTHIAQLASMEQMPRQQPQEQASQEPQALTPEVVEEPPTSEVTPPREEPVQMEDDEEEYHKGSTMRIEMPSSFDIPKPIKRTIVIKRRS
ncbi:MAG: hypothetical protein EOM20_15120 [Spartobacteria bacterium]|nr:hypothetical protein [Spartobacteria bacterium]